VRKIWQPGSKRASVISFFRHISVADNTTTAFIEKSMNFLHNLYIL